MRLRHRSRKTRVADAFATYLKYRALIELGKAVRKSVKGWAAYKTVKRAPAPVKALPLVAGLGAAGAAGAVAARKRRSPSEPTAV
jgi:hypothetical protein